MILHNLGRGPHVPSLTPFAVKLETYIRLAGIRYEVKSTLEYKFDIDKFYMFKSIIYQLVVSVCAVLKIILILIALILTQSPPFILLHCVTYNVFINNL